MKIEGFDWDSGNLFKNETKHGLSREVIEVFFQSDVRIGPDLKHSAKETRYLALGKTSEGRAMIVAFTFRVKSGLMYIRPISARYLHKKEIQKYEQTFAKNEK